MEMIEATRSTKLHGDTSQKTSVLLCDFFVIKYDMGKSGDVVLHKVRGPHNLYLSAATLH
jgi:hypothetical protein